MVVHVVTQVEMVGSVAPCEVVFGNGGLDPPILSMLLFATNALAGADELLVLATKRSASKWLHRFAFLSFPL